MRNHLRAAALCNLCLALIAVFVGILCFYDLDATPTSTEENVYRSGSSESNRVSLLFNVYWGTEEIYRILDTLDKYGAKSTFFLGGCWADDNNACVKEIFSRGHELGSHGYFHREHDKLTYEENLSELQHTGDLIAMMTGYTPKLFAPPSGAYGKETLAAAEALGYKVILWSKDTIDWRDKDAQLVYNRATAVSGGDFVLMHPMEHTAEALDGILRYYRDHGFSVVTVSENLGYGGQ